MNYQPPPVDTTLVVATRTLAAEGVVSSPCAAPTAGHSPPGHRAPTSTYSWTAVTATAF